MIEKDCFKDFMQEQICKSNIRNGQGLNGQITPRKYLHYNLNSVEVSHSTDIVLQLEQ